MAMDKPAAMAIAVATCSGGLPAAASCANAGMADIPATITNAKNPASFFICFSLYKSAARRWFPSSSCSRSHTGRRSCPNAMNPELNMTRIKLVLVGRGHPDVQRGKNGKDESLHDCHKHM